VLSGTLLWGGTAQGAMRPGVYRLSAAGLAASNYRISYQDGLLTIREATSTPPAGQVERNALASLQQAGEQGQQPRPAPADVPLRIAPDFIKVD